MSANQAFFPITTMARVLGMSKAGYYAWLTGRIGSRRSRWGFAETGPDRARGLSRQTYGKPRVHAYLQALASSMGVNGLRLMQLIGLVGASHRHGSPTATRRDKGARLAPDLVDRNFTASRRIVSVAPIVAVAVSTDGNREVVGLHIGPSEAETFWSTFLKGLLRRGLHGIKLVISDAHEGLRSAIRRTFSAS